MTFLNPLLLFGLVAAAIPLIIHLFNFRRPRRVDFSSLAFLREVQRSTMQRVRIKQWLLLVLRTLAIAALVLAFARPTLEGGLPTGFGGRPQAALAIVIDNTPSMQVRDAQGAYFDQAVDAARAIVASTGSRDEVFVITTSGSDAGNVAARPGGPGAAAALDGLRVSEGSGFLDRAVARALDGLARSAQPARELYVISDFQASTLVGPDARRQRADVQGRLVPVGGGREANVAITAVRVVSRIVEPGQPVRMEADLVNFGDASLSSYAASVFLGAERVAQAGADLPPGIPTTLSFTLTPSDRGWLAGSVQTEDDAFAADNSFRFSLYVPEVRRLLLVEGSATSARYLGTVLSERMTGGRVRFDVRTIAESGLPAADLTAYDVVLLAGPEDLSDGEVDRLARFVGGGGGLFWTPGDNASLTDYNALLSEIGGGMTIAVTSGTRAAPIDRVEMIDLEHPLFDGVLDGRERTPERPELYRRLTYRPGPGAEHTVMALAGGTPFLQEIRHGRGAVLFLAAALDPAWSDLPMRGLFVPLVYRSVFLLSSAGAVAGESYPVGAPGELLLPGPVAEEVAVTGPLGERVVPVRRDGVGTTLLSLDGVLDRVGVYDVEIGDRLARRIVANPDPRESNLALADPEEAVAEFDRLLGLDASVLRLETADEASAHAAVVAHRTGVELWNVFMGLALLFLVLEMAVARHWRPESTS